MTPSVCHYYVTLRCNDTCEFCPHWRVLENQYTREGTEGPKELGAGEIGGKLKEIRAKGVKTLNITGGEPLLREDLPELLKLAKELGFSVELTTNGILYPEKGRALAGLVDKLFFSLDYPVAAEHDRSRGVECFHTVLAALEYARTLGQQPIVNYTLTRDNIRFLPEMVELAGKIKVYLNLNPVYDFNGTQGFESATIDHIKYYARRRHVLVNYALLEFVRSGGNRVYLPRCRAAETTVTLLPDGRTVSPCYDNQGGAQGKADVCSSCMRWPYMLPSFANGLDKYFWLDRWTALVQRLSAKLETRRKLT
ncbi:MAG: radical SAM protein [Candidatus Margulisiibacteriota bacterium]